MKSLTCRQKFSPLISFDKIALHNIQQKAQKFCNGLKMPSLSAT